MKLANGVLELRIGRKLSIGCYFPLFLSSLLFFILGYFIGSRPSINGVGTGFTTSGSLSMGGAVLPRARSTDRSLQAVLIGSGTCGFIRLCM